MMVTLARMVVHVCESLRVLDKRVDQNIVFNAQTGIFAFRLLSQIGESVVPALIQMINRVERLVDSVEVLHKHDNTLKCKLISLGKIIFNYGTPSLQANGAKNAIALDLGLYEATIDFGGPTNSMNIVLERGNPHIRIIDHLTNILNGEGGLDGVATLLPLTLPLLRGFDSIEFSWESVVNGSEAVVIVRSVESYIVRYNLTTPNLNSNAELAFRKVQMEIKMENRKGGLWWYLQRSGGKERESDEIDAALQPTWDSAGEGWFGMRNGGVAKAEGIEELLGNIDEVMRTVVLAPPPAAPLDEPPILPQQTPAPRPQIQQNRPPQPAPQARMKAQVTIPQYPQRPPSHNQGQAPIQNQNRNNQVKREVVEID